MNIDNILQQHLYPALPGVILHGIRIAGIIVGAYVIRRIGSFLIERVIRRIIISEHLNPHEADKKRAETLIRIFRNTYSVIVWMTAFLMILPEAGLNIGPLLAGVGIAGLAVGFGAQYLIKDIISGLFTILENQYRVGDVVCFDGTCGLVENITLRMTTLRDLDGTVHHIPHGELRKVSNLSKKFARVNLNIGVSYSSNLDHVIAVVNRVGKELSDDPAWKKSILAAPQFLRVDDFADSAIILKILGETKPSKQWDVMGELRKRIKTAFDAEGIEIPFPQRVVHSAVQGK